MVRLAAAVLMIFVTVCKSDTCEQEPVSSQVYDIIGKLVNLEEKIGKWEKERENFQESMLSIMEYRKEEMKLFQEDITNRTQNLGPFTVSKAIAFNAYATKDAIYGSNEVVVFSAVLLNEGGGYNIESGYFTAPITGLYYFSAHVCNQNAYYMVISIVHNGVNIATTTEYESVSAGSCSSVSAPAMVKAGESVFVKSSYTDSKLKADNSYRRPSFKGVLIHST